MIEILIVVTNRTALLFIESSYPGVFDAILLPYGCVPNYEVIVPVELLVH